MRSPLESAGLLEFDSVGSTQDVLAAELRAGNAVGAVLALEQTQGRGRFQRVWHSPPGECLAVSMALSQYKNHPRPYLVGMAVALAAAQAFECQLRWPNDLLLDGRKLGGVLTEMIEMVPVVGLGVNLGQSSFPEEIESIATSLFQARGLTLTPRAALDRVLARIIHLPEPTTWPDLQPLWMERDATEGKRFRLPDGREAIAHSIGPGGELIALVDGEPTIVLAADALP